MKKNIIFFAAVLLCTAGFARPVSQQKAQDVAMKFLGLQPMTKGADPLHLIWTGEPMTKVGGGDPALYVFEIDGGGFIVVSGDDCLRPVLGYSEDSDFIVDNMPDHIAGWFNSISKMVRQAREAGTDLSNEVSNEWKSAPHRSSREVRISTALWWQNYPYNMYTPMLVENGKEHCTTGCTNTATAIVMRYHKHPEAGSGVLPDYTYTKSITRTQPGHALGHKYDWDNMPTYHLDESTPMYQAQQVAQLMYDCGVMNKCKWNPYNSDTPPENIPNALVTYMGYDKSIRYVVRTDFDTNEWEKMIRDEIDAKRPIIYAAQHESGNGHAWVIDGYANNGYFYMNWGWGGNSNGYFVISPLSKAANALTANHRMVIGIKPDEGGEPYGGRICLSGNSVSSWRFNLNKSFTAIFNVKNYHVLDRTVRLRVALTDKNGNVKVFISEPEEYNIAAYTTTEVKINCIIKSMPNTDDQMMLFYEDNGLWEPAEYNDDTIIKMKGLSALEDCTSVSYSKENHILTVNSEKDNAIFIYYTDSGGSYILYNWFNDGFARVDSSKLSVNLPDWMSPNDITIRVFNISESKSFQVKF